MHRSVVTIAPAGLALCVALAACDRFKATETPPEVDLVPPTVPQGVSAIAPSPSRVSLSWIPSTDAGTGVGGYEVLRDGVRVATVDAPTAAFEDAHVAAGTGYVYAVRAFDRAAPPNVSAASAPAGVTTPVSGATPGLDARPSNTTCLAPPRPTAPGPVQLQRVFPALTFANPLAMLHAPGDATRWFVVEQGGVVKTFPNVPTASATTTFVDLSAKVDASGETGLLGMAFHPDWPATPEVFLSYVTTSPLRSHVTRMRAFPGNATLDPSTEETILAVDQPYSNHNGGGIVFGPDRYLYLGLGDGGSGGDPGNRAQTLTTLLGKFLRIDVAGTGAGYAIPPDNPYAGNAKCGLGTTPTAPCPEIWAFGFRNPWRWSFDRDTGALWVGDVGQGTYEEVDRVERGKNYGWRLREGAHCYGSLVCPGPGTVQNGAEMVDPVTEYDHSLGVSITGGYVYRGTAIPSLRGSYLFGDFGSGRIWSHEPGAPGLQRTELLASGVAISSFGEGLDGELYVTGHGNGQLYRLALASAPPADTIPASLADTGCVDPADPTQPAPGLVPYRPNAPFWSDGAVKERWMALPDGQDVVVGADGDWDFPSGTVLVKSFRVGGKLVETRLFMRHPDGTWAGYDYEWNDAQTAATRVTGGKMRALAAQTWLYPSEAQCLQCHTAAAGRSLGLETAQLNGDLTYPATGRTANQLATLEAVGLVSLPGLPADLPALPDPLGSAPLEERARAWLHSNCSNCHRPGGPTPVALDLRVGTPLASTGTCGASPQAGDLGLSNARIVAPGAPERSVLLERMRRLDVARMPPVGSLVVDQGGAQLVSDWIASLAACP